ncbi:hypothetical protein [Sphaerisporangium sp. NPDC051011]|uniref:hypothetical protein n=1 Tax=Sphaerisporangium sp. NPDC051011 TaxID=3155792 RepID=UPI0033CD1A9D
MNGYTYTTISMHPGNPAHVGVNIYPDQHASVRHYPVGDDARVFMSIDFDHTSVSIGTASDTTVTDTHVKFARDLFEAAARFLADCERLRDQHTRHATDKATPGKAA